MNTKKELKHAYLIMAHGNVNTLNKLIRMLDSSNNDIYIHIDLKAMGIVKDINLETEKSKIYFVKNINVKWGHYSQVQCEILLLKEAIKKKYDYYHLLSGADLPIKSQEYICDFFNKNNGKEFVHFDSEFVSDMVMQRVRYYHFFQAYMRSKNKIVKYLLLCLEKISLGFQKCLNIRRNKNLEIQKGANWFSITGKFAEYVVMREKWIYKHFKNTANPDEMFLQTLIINSKFKDSLFYSEFDNSYESIMRYIDWTRGEPYVWRNEDYNELVNSQYLYARKFDEKIDDEIIDKIFNYIIMK